MKEYIDSEIVEKFNEFYNDKTLYKDGYGLEFSIKVTRNTKEAVHVVVRDMYEESIMLPSFQFLCAIKDMFDTTNIDFDTDSYEGCETCGYGGKREIEFIIKETTNG